jgi:hypothetical protein
MNSYSSAAGKRRGLLAADAVRHESSPVFRQMRVAGRPTSARRRLSPTMERMTGIEPALSAWEAEVLPLNYIRMIA